MGKFSFKQFDIDDSGCGMKIGSDSVVLAPWFLNHYRDAGTLLDVGAGSGLLSLMGAQILPSAQIIGVEIDASAASAAQNNAALSPWASRIGIINQDITQFAPNQKFDLIISNPPYFTNGESSPETRRAAARHQSELTFSTLLKFASRHLSPNGHLGFISPVEQESDIIFEAELAGLKLSRLCRLQTAVGKAPKRLLWDFAKQDVLAEMSTLAMRDFSNEYTSEYKILVEPFYLNL